MKSEKAEALESDGSNKNLTDNLTMRNSTLNPNQFQLEITVNIKCKSRPVYRGFNFVCDECARPLHLYGENFIETYTNGKVNVLRCLCDLHADEMEVKA